MAPQTEAVPEFPLRQKRKRTHLRSPFRERHAKKEAEAAANAAAAAAREEAEAEERAYAEAAATPGRPQSRRHRPWVRPKRDRRRAQQLPQGRRVRLVGEWDADEEAWIQFSEFRLHFSTTGTAFHNLESLGTCATRQRHWPWEALGGDAEEEGGGGAEDEGLPEDAPPSAVYERAVQRAAQPRYAVRCGGHRLAPFAGRDDLVLLVDSADAQRVEGRQGQAGEEEEGKDKEGKEEEAGEAETAQGDADGDGGEGAGPGTDGADPLEGALRRRRPATPAPVQEVKVLVMVAAGSAAAPGEVEVGDRCAEVGGAAEGKEEKGEEGYSGGAQEGKEGGEGARAEEEDDEKKAGEGGEDEDEDDEEDSGEAASQAEADAAEAGRRARRHTPGLVVTVRRRALPGTHTAPESLAPPADVVARLHVSPGGTAVVPVLTGPGRSAFALEVDGPLGYTVTCASRHPFTLGEETEVLMQQPVCAACVTVGEQEGEAGPVPPGERRTLFRHRLRLPSGWQAAEAGPPPPPAPVTAASVASASAAEGKDGEEGEEGKKGEEGKEGKAGGEGGEESKDVPGVSQAGPALDVVGYPAVSGLAEAPLCSQGEAALEVLTTPAHAAHSLRAWLLHPASGASVEVRGVDLALLPLADLATAVAARPARVRGSSGEGGEGEGTDESEVLLVVAAEAHSGSGLGPCAWRRRLRWPVHWVPGADKAVPQSVLQMYGGQYTPNARRIAFSDALSVKKVRSPLARGEGACGSEGAATPVADPPHPPVVDARAGGAHRFGVSERPCVPPPRPRAAGASRRGQGWAASGRQGQGTADGSRPVGTALRSRRGDTARGGG